MAEVRQRLSREALDYSRQISARYLLEIQNKHSRSGVRTSSSSSVSARCLLLGNILNGGVTVGAPQDGYTRVTPPVSKYSYYLGPNVDYPLCHGTRVRGCLYRSNAVARRTLCPSLESRCLCRGHGQFVSVRAYSGNGSRSEPLYRTKTGYYDILEVTTTATQAQIKTAYYKQSFIYHPDRNAGSDEATTRFSEISEAYTVLGNKALRKKYDRGLLSQSDLTATARPSAKDTSGSSARPQTESRRSVMGADSRANIFDFDKFIRSHYSEQLQREKDIRVRKEEMQRKKQETIGEKSVDNFLELGIGLMVAMAVALLVSIKRG